MTELELAERVEGLQGPDRPIRVQLSRKKGWRMPANTVSVARPGKWGNPFAIGHVYPIHEGYGGGPVLGEVQIANAGDAVAAFRSWVSDEMPPVPVQELRGKNLACWCPLVNSHGEYSPCHADVLLSLANDIPEEEVIRENIRRAKGEAL